MAYRRNRQRSVDIWPGFVDALGNLINVLVFVLLIFVLAQFFLGRALSGRDEALLKIQAQLAELGEMLNLERRTADELRAQISALSGELAAANARVEALSETRRAEDETAARLHADIAALEALRDRLEQEIRERDRLLADGEGKLAEQERLSEEARAQAEALRAQLEALQQEMARIADALDAAEKVNREQKAQIADLGRQLNRALATKVAELQKYRSEFFGRLREILGERADIRIEGDRFVFQSEVLFDSGSAVLREEGRAQIAQLATTLKQIAATIPPEIDWILRIDGHTDPRPINTAQFKSNWDLSAARAISVVNFLTEQGIPPRRLAAAGFGEFHPLSAETSEEAMRRNRRIELKFDQR